MHQRLKSIALPGSNTAHLVPYTQVKPQALARLLKQRRTRMKRCNVSFPHTAVQSAIHKLEGALLTLPLNLLHNQSDSEEPMPTLTDIYNLPLMASGEKTKARDILAAIRTLTQIEQAQRPATPDERQILGRFSGFGAVALSLFPNPVTGRYKDESWRELGEELRAMLSPEEYDSAKRTTFTAFYTSPTVIKAMHEALARLGVPEHATVLEPGCGTGNFISQAPAAMRFIGVELDRLSGRIARALHPGQDIRIENFRDTRLPEGRIDAVIGNVPFADIRLEYGGQRLAAARFLSGEVPGRPETWRHPRPGHEPLHPRQAERGLAGACRGAGGFPGRDPPALRRLQAGRHQSGDGHPLFAAARARAAGKPCRPGLAGDGPACHRGRRHPHQPVLPASPGHGPWRLEP